MKKGLETTTLAAAVLGSLVLINIIGLGLFGRLDLTCGKEFTLSSATRATLKDLSDPVTVRAYFSKDLPPPHASTARYVKDLLEEYYASSGGNLRYEFIDPTSEETDSDKEKKKEVKSDIFGRAVREETSVERELRLLGIPPVQVRVNEGDKLEVKRAYMGISVQLSDKKEVIPVVSDTAGLEYDLTTALRKVARAKAPKVALLAGHDGPDPAKEMSRLQGLLGQLYEVTSLDLTQKAEIPDDVVALLVVGPKTPLSDAEQRAVDKFVMSGRSVAFLLGAVAPDLQTLNANPAEHGLTAMLSAYGVTLSPGLVIDPECASINVQQQRGFMRVSQPVRFPFVPVPKTLDGKHPLTRGLAEVAFPFMSPLELSGTSGEGAQTEILVKSSKESFVQQPPFNLDPFQSWTRDSVQGTPGEQAMVATLSGTLKSAFPGGEGPAQASNARVLVAGGYMFVLDQFLSPGNQALALNLFDWLVQDDALLAVRTRGLNAAPLDDKISDTARNSLKYANILGLPVLLMGFGLVRWRMREARRAKASL
ncbi:MAG: GldG family protein [Deltaproteobacteria bacterium]|nr:GldG family protein [Deltaproteobacteria bacterium]